MVSLPVISSWDPRATSSGSIDPLGALRAYNAIAGFLMPGATTITTRVRYLSWLCAGLRLLDEVADAPSGGRAGRSRRQRLLAWERFLVLATARHAIAIGAPSDAAVWRGLRGISYVRRAIEQGKLSTDFELLSNQAAVGGVGTYWVTLVNGGLVEDVPAELTHRGTLLADELLKRLGPSARDKLRRILAGDVMAFSEAELVRWGKAISLDVANASPTERRGLRDALLEPRTHRQFSLAIDGTKHAQSNPAAFKRLERRLRAQKDDTADRMAAVMEVTRAFEALHAGLLDQFDRLLAIDTRGVPVSLAIAARAIENTDTLRVRGSELAKRLDAFSAVPREITSPLRQFLGSVQSVLDVESPRQFVLEICRLHERVQSGKLDASRQPKQPWIALQDGAIIVAPRFAVDVGRDPRGDSTFTHPYRIESFAGMLSELGMPGATA